MLTTAVSTASLLANANQLITYGTISNDPITYQPRPIKESEIVKLIIRAHDKNVRRIAVVYGEGGTGKSTMVAHLVRNWQKNPEVPSESKHLFTSVLWLSLMAFQPGSRGDDFYRYVAQQLRIGITDTGDILRQKLKQELKARQPILVVADDVYSKEIADRLIELGANELCLIITRISRVVHELSGLINVIPVIIPFECFTVGELKQLLSSCEWSFGKPQGSELDDLAEACYGQPIGAQVFHAKLNLCDNLVARATRVRRLRYEIDAKIKLLESKRGDWPSLKAEAMLLFALHVEKAQCTVTFDEFTSFLLFEESTAFTVEEMSIVWNASRADSATKCNEFCQRGLIEKTADNVYQVSDLLFEAAVNVVRKTLEQLRLDVVKKVITTDAASTIGGEERRPGENVLHVVIRHKLHRLLQLFVDVLPVPLLAALSFCQKEIVDDNRTPLDYLFYADKMSRTQWSWRTLLGIAAKIILEIDESRRRAVMGFFSYDECLMMMPETDSNHFILRQVADLEGFVVDQSALATANQPTIRRAGFTEWTDRLRTLGMDAQQARLFVAARTGLLAIIEEELSANKLDVDMKLFNGYRLLHVAVMAGNDQLVKILVKKLKASIQEMDEYGNTPLHVAAEWGQPKVVEFLLAMPSIDVNATNKDGWTALSRAACNGHDAVVKLLLSCPIIAVNAVDKDGYAALNRAATNGYEAVVKRLLAMPNIDENIATNSFGYTPLMWAACNGHDAVVRQLLVMPRIDVNAADRDGHTALLWAAYNWHEQVVERLLAMPNVDVNAANNYGVTPLNRAAFYGQKTVVKSLLAMPNINVNLADIDGSSPLHRAARNGYEEIVERLLAMPNIDVNAVDKDGETPLYGAAYMGYDGVVKRLLECPNIDVNVANNQGKTALFWAGRNGHEVVVKRLLAMPNIDVNTAS